MIKIRYEPIRISWHVMSRLNVASAHINRVDGVAVPNQPSGRNRCGFAEVGGAVAHVDLLCAW